jgi:hypothetical protein
MASHLCKNRAIFEHAPLPGKRSHQDENASLPCENFSARTLLEQDGRPIHRLVLMATAHDRDGMQFALPAVHCIATYPQETSCVVRH